MFSADAQPILLSTRASLCVLLLFAAALVAPEVLQLPHLYRGNFQPPRSRARAPPPAATAPAATAPADAAFFHPSRPDCVPSWDTPSAEAPFCHTALQCALHRDLGVNFSHGFYIEAGAFDGISGSHSLMYERHLCWKGLLVEPSDRYFGGAMREGGTGGGPASRPESTFLHGALVDSAHDGAELFAGIDNTPTNSVPATDEGQAAIGAAKPGAKKIRGYSVASALRALGVGRRGVDFFSLDIESWEMQALNGLEEFRPSLVVIEVWTHNTAVPENPRAVREKMAALGYEELVGALETQAGNTMFQDVAWRYRGA